MGIVLFDNRDRDKLQPFTLTKAVADLRAGILTGRERWEKISGQPVFVRTVDRLRPLYQEIPQGEHTWIDAAVLPDAALAERLLSLPKNTALRDSHGLIGAKGDWHTAPDESMVEQVENLAVVARLVYPWHIMQRNDEVLRGDYRLLTANRTSRPIPATVNVTVSENIFIEEGAVLSFCTINAQTGPVYIGRHAEIMEGCAIRGPFALGEHSVLKMNSRVYGATTLGPYCMGGGEIKNTVMMGYSNKGHDGYLGDSVVGEWCNFGAGSSNSNIKNTAGEIKVWSMSEKAYLAAGKKCGMVMGDYSRAAINSAINTGSMIGVCANVFGAGLLPTIIANFSWGVSGTKYEFEKAMQDIDNWKKLKGKSLTAGERAVLEEVFSS